MWEVAGCLCWLWGVLGGNAAHAEGTPHCTLTVGEGHRDWKGQLHPWAELAGLQAPGWGQEEGWVRAFGMSWAQGAPHDSLDVIQSPVLELCRHSSSPGTL